VLTVSPEARPSTGLDKGRDTDRWTFSVQDTGPGIDEIRRRTARPGAPRATEVSNEAKEASTDRRRTSLRQAPFSPNPTLCAEQQSGEGVGLSIVKRLCELLDAGLELATKPGRGTTFRVILPRTYDNRAE